MKATVTSKGQITIPVKIREKLGITAGTVLDFDEEAHFVKATRKIDWDTFRKFGNKAKDPFPGMTSMEILVYLRGPVELPPKKPDANRD